MKKIYTTIILLTFYGLAAKAQFTNIFDFYSVVTDGFSARGDLISDSTFLYGTTSQGGINATGTLFKIKPDGSGYLKIHDFSAAGGTPTGSLIYDGTYFYGLAAWGGSGLGYVFKVLPDGSGFVNLMSFSGTATGSHPTGSLVSDATYMYGMTPEGGANNKGTVFKIKPDGTGFVKLLDFAGTSNGSTPVGTLIYDGTYLYGVTQSGGTSNYGTIFKIMPDGSGYVKILDFTGTNGQAPQGALLFDGIYLYATTDFGGIGYGTIVKIMPNGSNYFKVRDFNSVNGRNPIGSLISDGTYLYGTTQVGGINNSGTLFQILPNGSSYTNLFDFNMGTGNGPTGSVIKIGNVLYGTTPANAAHMGGSIFKFALTTSGVKELPNNNGISVSPNPSDGTFTISQNNTNKTEIEINNIVGEIIYKTTVAAQQTTIDLSSQPKGIYFVHIIEKDKNTINKKIVIQ